MDRIIGEDKKRHSRERIKIGPDHHESGQTPTKGAQ